MRVLVVAAALLVVPLVVHAQTRPAPDTPGEPEIFEEAPVSPAPRSLTDAVRVLVVTSGIIGGFVAADILSGGALTGPLLRGGSAMAADAAVSGGRSIPRAVALRPIIARPLVPVPVARLPEFRRALGRSLARNAAPPPLR